MIRTQPITANTPPQNNGHHNSDASSVARLPEQSNSNPWESAARQEAEIVALAHILRCPALQDRLFGEDFDTWHRCFGHAGQQLIDALNKLHRAGRRIPETPDGLATIVTRVVESEQFTEMPGLESRVREFVSPMFADGMIVTDDPAAASEVVGQYLTTYGVATEIASASGMMCDLLRAVRATEKIHAIKVLADDLRMRGGDRCRLRAFSMEELDQVAEPPQWLVRGVMVAGETLFLSGPMKALKSGIAVDLAVGLATPRNGTIEPRFLNTFPCEPVDHVLLFSAESGMWVTRNRIHEIADSRPATLACGLRTRRPEGWRAAHQLNLHTIFEAPKLASKQDQQRVKKLIRDFSSQVVIFDPFYLIALSGTNTEAGNVFQMGERISELEDLCKSEGATPVFVHHFTKTVKTGAVPALKDMSFAGSAERAAQWLLINHRVPFDSSAGHCRLWMAFGGRAGQSGLYGLDIHEGQLDQNFRGREWNVQVLTREEIHETETRGSLQGPRAQQERNREQAILTHLVGLSEGEGTTLTALHQAVGARSDACRRSLRELETRRLVERTTVTRNGRKYDAWQVTLGGRQSQSGEFTSENGVATP
ncbi:AAA family ATPase [Blastopirellula sp. JC732]|uniref:AAA family ATPase n=1 Tax=Blastopirellula sediminis TaxID=2894196 RepID=A0A9X1MPK6_9BACT|nr:AAA family ATPase [Blastopirellula sediminis]MCC9606213.1 AAA family ATPase [Blastopirellula sediminis]MCC9630489.1 AAA family ATPase [Blastopirellula sediminis]